MFKQFAISSAIWPEGRRSPSSILRSAETEQPDPPGKLLTRESELVATLTKPLAKCDREFHVSPRNELASVVCLL